MINKPTEPNPDLNLRMASVPEAPRQAVSPPAPIGMRLRSSFTKLVGHLCTLLAIAVLSATCYLVISRFLLETVQVVGVSMVPTLAEHGRYLLNRWAFRDRDPQRADIVVIRDPADNGFSVKRIVATAGESVYLKDGKVYVNGKELVEPYLSPGTHTYTYSQAKEQLITCGSDQYFLLGDNRLRSIDSRCYGPVPRQNILGLVVVR
jgi:signal peptidase I